MQVHTWFQQDAANTSTISFCGGSAVACSYRSPDKESDNEDAAALIELSSTHGIIAVADGVGGQNAGDRAARAAIGTILKYCKQVAVESAGNPLTSIRSHLLDAIEAANREVLGWGIGAGATLVVAEYLEGKLRIIHVGDASAMVCSNRGRIKFLTVAHAPVAMAVELGFLNESEGLAHEDRNIISNCVGSSQMKIEVGPGMVMARRDSLLLSSDGLFDNLKTDEIASIIRSGSLKRQTDRLLEKARRRMLKLDAIPCQPDDLTMICFRQSPVKN